jgi:hypothetical protein
VSAPLRRCYDRRVVLARIGFIVASLALVGVAASCSDESSSGSSSSSSSSGGAEDPPSFEEDVVPILTTNCALAACHSAAESNLGIHLTYDPDQIYEELKKSSPTPGFAGAKFVVPGKPEESVLMAKLEGEQDSFGSCNGKCGTEMPPGELLAIEDRDVIRAWIKNGAKRD